MWISQGNKNDIAIEWKFVRFESEREQLSVEITTRWSVGLRKSTRSHIYVHIAEQKEKNTKQTSKPPAKRNDRHNKYN